MSCSRLVRSAISLALLGALFLPNAQAQDKAEFPQKPVRVIVPFAPGGAADILARTTMKYAAEETGWSIVVENVSGGGGLIGAQTAARSAPDGYTMLLCNIACAANQFMIKTDFNPRTAIAPVMVIGYLPNIVVVGPGLPVKSLKDFIDRARAKPNSVTIATSGPGSSSWMTATLLKTKAAIQTVEVPYRGSGAALPDLLAGRVDGMVMGLPESIPQVRSGKLHALGVTSTERAPSLPEVPTIAEAGVPGYQFLGWLSLFAPKATPAPLIAALNAGMNKGLQSAALRKRFAELSIQPAGGAPELAGKLLNDDIDLWGPILTAYKQAHGKK